MLVPAIVTVLVAAVPLQEARRHWAAGEFDAGRRVLRAAGRDGSVSPAARADALAALAAFDEEIVGSHRMARRDWKDILRLDLPDGHPLAARAVREIARIDGYDETWAAEDAIVDGSRSLTEDPAEIRARIADLRALLERSPGYPRRAVAHHLVGVNCMWLEDWGGAVAAFDKAIALRPAIGLVHPAPHYRRKANRAWIEEVVPPAATAAVTVLSVLAVVFFLRSRAWRRIGKRQLLVVSAVMALWLIAVLGVSWCGYGGPPGAMDYDFVTPVEVHTGPFMEGGSAILPLLWCGLAGIAAVFLFALGTAGIRQRVCRLALNLLFAALMCGSLTVLWYMEQFFDASYRYGEGLSATYVFHVRDITMPIPEEDVDGEME